MEYEEKVFEVLRNFMEYGNYKGSVNNAVLVIKKSHPEKTKEELIFLFESSISAYKEAIILVHENINHYSANGKSILKAETEFRRKHQEVPHQILSWIIGWVHHWYHER